MRIGLLIKPIETRVTQLSGAGHNILAWRQIETFDFAEIVNNNRLKQGMVCQIVRFIYHLSWNYTHNFENIIIVLLPTVVSDYCKKWGVRGFFGGFVSVPFK